MNRESRSNVPDSCLWVLALFLTGSLHQQHTGVNMNLHSEDAFAQRRGACALLFSVHRESQMCPKENGRQRIPLPPERAAAENSTQRRCGRAGDCGQLLAHSPTKKKSWPHTFSRARRKCSQARLGERTWSQQGVHAAE